MEVLWDEEFEADSGAGSRGVGVIFFELDLLDGFLFNTQGTLKFYGSWDSIIFFSFFLISVFSISSFYGLLFFLQITFSSFIFISPLP